jgi:hypothetical protein
VLAVTLDRPGLISARDVAELALETSISTGAGTGKTDIRGSGLHYSRAKLALDTGDQPGPEFIGTVWPAGSNAMTMALYGCALGNGCANLRPS